MQVRIGHRIFIGFLLTALTVLGLVFALTRWNFERGFLDYVNESEVERLRYLAGTLQEFYGAEGGWDVVRDDAIRWRELMAPPRLAEYESVRQLGAVNGGVVAADPLAISPRVTVLDKQGGHLFGPPANEGAQLFEPILHRGEVVGSLQLHPLETLASELDTRFAEQQASWFAGSAVFALALAGLLALAYTRQLVSPIADLTKGTRALTAGRFSERIEAKSSDELGELAKDFNTLAETLERHQRSQRQWIADISHELRTPLAVLRAELQGMEDGLRNFDEPSRKTLALEVERLTDLVNDIYDLSVSDIGALRYRKSPDNVVDVLQETIEIFEHRISDAGLKLQVELPEKSLVAMLDRVRLGQLFVNVLENSVRYTDPGGRIQVSCHESDGKIHVVIEDSAPCVSEEQLPHLFERLYRVDSSRRRSTGGAGLGLAICKNIAHGHEGTITATKSDLGGIRIELVLPADAKVSA